MDLNQLYFDHQLLLMRAGRAASRKAQHEHEVCASHIAGRIGCMQRTLGASAAPTWEALASVAGTSSAAPQCYRQGHAW